MHRGLGPSPGSQGCTSAPPSAGRGSRGHSPAEWPSPTWFAASHPGPLSPAGCPTFHGSGRRILRRAMPSRRRRGHRTRIRKGAFQYGFTSASFDIVRAHRVVSRACCARSGFWTVSCRPRGASQRNARHATRASHLSPATIRACCASERSALHGCSCRAAKSHSFRSEEPRSLSVKPC